MKYPGLYPLGLWPGLEGIIYTVFQTRVGMNRVPVQIEHFDNLNRARLRAMGWGMVPDHVAGINVGMFDADTLPDETDEAWGPNGRVFTTMAMP